jgi:uncharacterized protein with ParB-like and HNH nuclease domain
MANINIEKAFVTDNKSVFSYLSTQGQGLYIPLYQRDYSWDKENITQLQEDISNGILRIVNEDDEQEIRFLGTIITLVEANRDKIFPIEPQVVPGRIEVLIDGQQRLSTIALFSTLLLKHLNDIVSKIKDDSIEQDLKDIYNYWEDKLLPIFCVDIKRKRKPKIIRGNMDFWTEVKDVDVAYKSSLSNYVGNFIAAHEKDGKNYPIVKKEKDGKTLFQNLKTMDNWIKDVVRKAHIVDSEEFPNALNILNSLNKIDIWNDERDNLLEIIKEKDFVSPRSTSYKLSELVQVISVCHYLLDRCCFTVIQPTDENWAFDMFQSLNATGTPLTAIETFKPRVVNETDENEDSFKSSKNELYFTKVDKLFEDIDTAQQKNKRTNEFITSFFTAYNGQQISSHFSHQRKSLIDAFDARETYPKRIAFVEFFGNYADFYKNIWIECEKNNSTPFNLIQNYPDADLATMLIHFLKVSNHKMAITVLGNFYAAVLNRNDNSENNFISAVKAISAFYFIWRSAYPNAGLDNTYREFFKSDNKTWKYEANLSIDTLKSHIRETLHTKKILDKNLWKQHAEKHLNFKDAGTHICKLAIMLSIHDTIEDHDKPGLIKQGRPNSRLFLNLNKWLDSSLKTVEHIAPQTNNGNWDIALYEDDKMIHSVGNLTLLTNELNASAGNKGWKEKFLYYRAVSVADAEELQNIFSIAKSNDITLSEQTIALLQKSEYSEHLKHLINLEIDATWSADFVKERTTTIIDNICDKIFTWIE